MRALILALATARTFRAINTPDVKILLAMLVPLVLVFGGIYLANGLPRLRTGSEPV